MHFLIIGAGTAGVIAAETLRKNNQDAEITIIGSEPEPPYSRMAIPYFLEGKIEQAGTYIRDPSTHFAALNINIIQDTVTSIDTTAQLVILQSTNNIHYDKLLISTGSKPYTPPIPGIELDIVHSCWTLQDARDIIQLAQPGSNVVLIGAGFIGCIILESLLKRGINLTVVEAGNRMVPRMLNDKAGGLIKSWCIDKGINVKTSSKIDSIIKDSNGSYSVKLSDGQLLPADLVITATGVMSNTDFLENTEIQIDKGILVNQYLQSSNPNIYAAGDVAQALDFSSGDHEVQAIQPTATDHGRIAALNMCGKKVNHQGSLNMNVLDTLGLISCSFGSWMGIDGGDSVEIFNEQDYRYLNLQFEDDILIGASCTGLTQHIGILRGLIETRLKLGIWKDRLMQDPTQLMEAYMSCTQEFN